MIQAYVENPDGVKEIIERSAETPWIDRIPFTFIRANAYSNASSIVLQNHLILNTSQPYFYKAFIDQTFKVIVNVPVAVTPNTRIGLFDLYGNFVEDITQSNTGLMYTCKVSYNVFPNNYIIMPFEYVSGVPTVIERAPGAAVMDRLPLAVDYDWGFRSMRSTTGIEETQTGNTSVYPNPVKDVLNVSTDEAIENITVFNLSGKKVKETTSQTGVSLGNLPSGTYIVRITTDKAVETYKIQKD